MPIIHNDEHYTQVIQKVSEARKMVWIGTADIKDLHVQHRNRRVSFLHVLQELAQHRVEIRLLHAKKPGPRFQSSFSKLTTLQKHMEMTLCPRVHFKMIVVDAKFAYFGSANFTGAGLGMKSSKRRNFETGMVTQDPDQIDDLMQQYDDVWRGSHCRDCGRRDYCEEPIL